MKAIVLRELGDPGQLRLEDVPDPVPGSDEVVIRLRAAALNHRDVWIRRGRYPGIHLPIILGSDGAGDVVAIGNAVEPSLMGKPAVIYPALDWGTDERVPGPNFRILGLPDDGTYAELIKVPAVQVFPKPDRLSLEEAAAIPLASLTAYRAVVNRAKVQAGEMVLVTGVGGGVSSFVLQIALKCGASVIVTSGSESKLARARDLGATNGVNYRHKDWEKKVQALCGGQGPHVIIDSVGGETFEKIIEIARPGARIVTYGATTGTAKQLEVRRIFWKQLNVLGSTMGTAKEFAEVLRLYSDGSLHPVIDQVFPLAEAAEAHRRMENAEQFGKIVLRIE
jgi:NADPH:quinone reductase-like Zn-dependent oxidoreductase